MNLFRTIRKLEKELELTKTGRASYDAGGHDKPPSANLPQCFMAAQFLITSRL